MSLASGVFFQSCRQLVWVGGFAVSVGVLLAVCAPALAASLPPGPHYSVPRSSGEITIDGQLDDAAWGQAVVVELDYKTQPGENIKPPQRTSVLLTYDSTRFYVAFKAFDSDPAQIRAHLSDRDQAWRDDWVGIVLDSFNDGRLGFEFFVSPLGVQMDLFYDDVNGNEDAAWDAIWDSAGRITAEGYVVGIGIPFSSINFPPASGEQTWGFQAIRSYPRSESHRFRSEPQDRDRSFYICQFSKMTGFADASPGRNLEIVPTLTAGRSDSRDTASGWPLRRRRLRYRSWTDGELGSDSQPHS